MKNIVVIMIIVASIISCTASKNNTSRDALPKLSTKPETIRIANDSLEYEVIIIDAGFNSWLFGNARPRGYYSEAFMENRNQIFVTEWNSRVNQPLRYNTTTLYEMRIDYGPRIRYGYEVNYLLYNYFIYFQITNNQKLAGFIPKP